MDWVQVMREGEMSRMTARSFALCSWEDGVACTDIRIGEMMMSLTFTHVKFKTLTRHPRDVKADGKNEPGFKGEILPGEVS